uniref:Uncharacterized protein n=1 Tax=Pyrodinium bahamense TaxID=73915 RepID=A0A7R9ZVT9_9DINO|mmetsp:Transcript_11970/g.32873  ORF Transcript_11970/g.32873 Transcript_11970/m.32873 type:complete len:220 (+) Transcript_11970:98-757(+)|eukprot:CAMPEP_0179041496 /NCGR_PEP_ID=MMETSP0796-20121207/16185_1 /TAXON_ID=73915 /ORGANISM="Pyrodinium bahamense, Strain pbaha01" /LENGTH=219 /DNA_ID=CAMNT_0020737859 /DNA_START=88 /DNA_END=747 /DNA_ORIENTATION=-
MAKAEAEQLLGPDGLPEASKEPGPGGAGILVVLMLVPRLVGLGIGFLIFKFGDVSLYQDQIALLASKKLGYLYLSVTAVSVLVQWLNVFPMIYKQKLNLEGNIRANMQFFKVNSTTNPLPYVVLEEQGVVGEYNRANRSLFHFIENMGGVLLCILCAGFVFPLPAFICTLAFFVGRVAHQIGYVSGYGKHGLGFGIVMLVSNILEGLVTLAALSSFGAF